MPREKPTPTVVSRTYTHDSPVSIRIVVNERGLLNVSMEEADGTVDGNENFIPGAEKPVLTRAANVEFDLTDLIAAVKLKAQAERVR
jgi:hypothetical protein